jgi:CubicO group peptidase (beta-lactamase class C family)
MKRRQWLNQAGLAGLAVCLPSCTSSPHLEELNLSAIQRFGGDAFGTWKTGRWLGGHRPDGRMPSLSITKSLAALAVVRGTQEGWLELDRPLGGILPEWRTDPEKRRITVRMLVNQSAGFASGVASLYRGEIQNKGKIAIALPLVDPPGARFRYGPASSEILAEILRRNLQKQGSTTEKFLTVIMKQIGISSPDWRKDLGEHFYLSTGAEFSVNDLGKLGQVIAKLASGIDTAGLKAEVFRDLASPRAANPMVAAGIWWNRNATRKGAFSIEPERHIDDVHPPDFWKLACLAKNLDSDWLAIVGSGGKRVYVLPSQNLVIARLGRSATWDDAAFLRALSA